MMKNSLFSIAILTLATNQLSATEITRFQAELTSDAVVSGGARGTSSLLAGLATFVLTEPDVGDPTISYSISLPGADLSRATTPDLTDNITAIHLHDTTVCASPLCVAGDTAGTLHMLNIFGAPRNDDMDMIFNDATDLVTGLWDSTDANSEMPAPSAAPLDYLAELKAGDLFLMIHTQTEPGGAYGGFLVLVPEPSSISLAILMTLTTSLFGLARFNKR